LSREATARPSRTAEYVALFRALESQRRGARLFDDPLARGFLPKHLRAALLAERLPLAGSVVPWFIDRRWPGARASAVVRTRMIDDALQAAVDEGVTQLVLLGAGFDSRAYRVAGLDRLRVFELDREATIERKRGALKRLLGGLPEHVSLLAIDFSRNQLAQALTAAGFTPAQPSFFIWEGVSHYLEPVAVRATLRAISELASLGSRLAFTYIDCRVLDEPGLFVGGPETVAQVGRVGEPFSSGFSPAQLSAELAACGLVLLSDEATAEAARRYFRPCGCEEPVFEFYRVAVAAPA
jgi:methyltransferase (TIGR00027 family)